MVRYFYAWIPVVLVWALVILACPWLGLIALFTAVPIVLGALAAVVWALVSVPFMLGRAVARRLQSRHSAAPRTAPFVHAPAPIMIRGGHAS
jgi:hypothetical protein